MSRCTLLYGLLLLTAVFLADLGLLPPFVQGIHDLPHADKVIHFLAYGTLALLANATLGIHRHWPLSRAIVIGSTLVAILATLDEGSNMLVAHRSWSLGDLAANYLGIFCVGILPLLAWRGKYQQFVAVGARPAVSLRPPGSTRASLFRRRPRPDVDVSPHRRRSTPPASARH